MYVSTKKQQMLESIKSIYELRHSLNLNSDSYKVLAVTNTFFIKLWVKVVLKDIVLDKGQIKILLLH